MSKSRLLLNYTTSIFTIIGFIGGLDGFINMVNRITSLHIATETVTMQALHLIVKGLSVLSLIYLLWWVISTITKLDRKVINLEEQNLIMHFDLLYRIETHIGNKPIDENGLKYVLGNMLRLGKEVKAMDIKKVVAEYYNKDIKDLPL